MLALGIVLRQSAGYRAVGNRSRASFASCNRMLAADLLGLTDEQIGQALDDGALLEVNHEKK